MELRHLRYFVAIAEERSFTRAAERLWIAQPGLSTQIRRLEAELGVQLFERHPRGVDLTDAGELFLERARAALAAADAARATGHDLEAGLVGTIRLGIGTEADWGPGLGLLDAFGRDYPDIELTVFESYGGTLVRDLHDARLEAVIVPSFFASAELARMPLGHERWHVLAGPSHRLAGERGPVAASELNGERLVLTAHRDGAAYDRVVTETLTGLGVAAELERGGSGPALLTRVASSEAVALTTPHAATIGGMVARPLEPARRIDFELLWRDETPSSALLRFIRAGRTAKPPRPTLVAVA
jgi:DNA-binding transcriptional LysR family regulator